MKSIQRRPLIFAVLILCIITGCGNAGNISILTYNVENLFDDVDNGNEYKEYDPSNKDWNRELLEIKLKNIAAVIRESTEGGPDIVCLQEVENQHVLELLNSPYLDGCGYSYRIIAPPSKSVTNVAVLSRLPIARSHIYNIPEWEGETLRSILEVEIEYRGKVLYILNNHWKSKSGRTKRTEEARILAVETLVAQVEMLLARDPDADIVLLGDLNESYDEYQRIHMRYRTAIISADPAPPEGYAETSLFLTAEPARAGLSAGKVIFYECWYELREKERGSTVYQEEWQTPDHILLSAGLFDSNGFLYLEKSFIVVRLPFLLDSKTGYPLRWKPKGKQKGFSDHLPLLIRVVANKSK